MIPFFLAQIDGVFVAVAKELVVGVGQKDATVKLIEENGQRYLPLPHGDRAIICDLQALLNGSGTTTAARRKYYLIVAVEEQLLALNIEKGSMMMADVDGARTLPPAFSERSRQVVPHVLVNGTDLILMVDLKALLNTTDIEVVQGCRQTNVCTPYSRID